MAPTLRKGGCKAVKLQTSGNMLVIRMKVVPTGAGGRRQCERKDNAPVLGELGFTRQEED